MRKIVLASGSPRRRELMTQIGLHFTVVPSQVEEIIRYTAPDQIVEDLSRQKAEDIDARMEADTLIIGADTVVAVDGEILGKPYTEENAVRMLQKLQGRSHQVYTGVTIVDKKTEGTETVTFTEKTDVYIYPMTEEEILAYVRTGDPLDKAGAYGIQGAFAAYIQGITGDYYNVVGLPVGHLYQELKGRI